MYVLEEYILGFLLNHYEIIIMSCYPQRLKIRITEEEDKKIDSRQIILE